MEPEYSYEMDKDRKQDILNALYESFDSSLQAGENWIIDQVIMDFLTDVSWFDSCSDNEDGVNEHAVWLDEAEIDEIVMWLREAYPLNEMYYDFRMQALWLSSDGMSELNRSIRKLFDDYID